MDDQLGAGRELDVRVALQVMGWTHDERGFVDPNGEHFQDQWKKYPIYPPKYSTDIAAALEIEEKLKARGLVSEYVEELRIVCGVEELGWDACYGDEEMFLFIHATPKQRCLAALKAVGAIETK